MKAKSKGSKMRFTPTIPSHKNRDNLLLVTTYPPFIKRIGEIREILKIPKEGFVNDEEHRDWWQWAVEESDRISDSAEFLKKDTEIRRALKRKETTLKEAERRGKELFSLLPINYLTQSIRELPKEFGLPENQDMALRYFILRNEIAWVSGQSYSIGPWNYGDRVLNVRYVPITVYAKLTDRDLKNLKKDVNEHFGKKLPSYKELKNVERNLEIEKLHNDGELDAVTYKMEKPKTEDIAERFLNNPKKKAEIYKIKEGLKKTRTNRFRQK